MKGHCHFLVTLPLGITNKMRVSSGTGRENSSLGTKLNYSPSGPGITHLLPQDTRWEVCTDMADVTSEENTPAPCRTILGSSSAQEKHTQTNNR